MTTLPPKRGSADPRWAGADSMESPVSLAPPMSGRDAQTATDAALAAKTTATFPWAELAGETVFQQGKTFLAILGLFTLLAHFSRLFIPRTSH